MEKFENYFEVTEQLYCEALKKMIPPARYVVYTVAFLVLGVSGGVMFYGKNFQTGALWTLLAVVLAIYGFFGINLKAKMIYRRQFPALCDKNNRFWRRTKFSDKKIHVTEPKNSAVIDYADIIGVSETKNLYVIILKEKQLLFIKKSSFSDATNSEFIEFLKEKCNVKD